MSDGKMLSQAEIDALLKSGQEEPEEPETGAQMSQDDIDAILAAAQNSSPSARDDKMSQADIDAMLGAAQDPPQTTADTALSQSDIDAMLAAAQGVPEPTHEGPMDQDEMDALLRAAQDEVKPDARSGDKTIIEEDDREFLPLEDLTPAEKDALGEIGNISMGSASTTLSELLNQKVLITSPRVYTITQEEMFSNFDVPYMVIHVQFTQGLNGFNVLIMRLNDAMVMSDLMMGGNGTPFSQEISEIEISAASEAMNQMIGTASTSLATMFRRTVNISPPVTKVLENKEHEMKYRLPAGDTVVVVSFRMSIGTLLDTELMQIMSLDTAREEANLLLQDLMVDSSVAAESSVYEYNDNRLKDKNLKQAQEHSFSDLTEPAVTVEEPMVQQEALSSPGPYKEAQPYAFSPLTESEKRKLDLLLDIPLNVSVVLGKTKRPIKEVLSLTPGAIVELSSLIDEPVEVYVNGTLVARGEVVVVNENFGVRISSIITPSERVQKLRA